MRRPARPIPVRVACAVVALTTLHWAAAGLSMAQPAPAASPARGAAPKAAPGSIAWKSLSAPQARVLAPLAPVWASLDDEQQQRWVELAARYPRFSTHDQRLMQERMTEWAAMSAADRRRARVQFQQASALSVQERQAQWQAYQSLSPDERRRLIDQAQSRGTRVPAPATAPAGGKSTVVDPLPAVTERPVAPAIVQAAPGATTRPLTRQAEPPRHQQAGLPKIVATPGFVDGSTLLPRRGAQAAPVRESASAPPRGNAR